MVLNSYSKINLSLSVNNKLKNGLHEIQSHYCLINLSDIIISKKDKNSPIFKDIFSPFSYIEK